MKLSGAPTIILFTFFGGFFGFLQTTITTHQPTNRQQWSAAVIGAVMAAVTGVFHYYQTPNPNAAVTKMMRKL